MRFLGMLGGSLQRHSLWIILLLAAGGSLAGLFALHFFERPKPDLKHAAGEALAAVFIACFVALIVDPFLKRTLVKEGMRGVFKYLYGFNLPSALQDFFEDNVVGTKMMRTNCRLHWKVKPSGSSSAKVDVQIHASFKMWNFSNRSQKYKHRAFATDEPGGPASVLSMYCKDNKTQKSIYRSDSAALSDVVVGGGLARREQKAPAHDVMLEPEDEGRYTFGVNFSAECTWPSGSDWFYFQAVTRDVEVIVSVDEGLRNHRFGLLPGPDGSSSWQIPEWDVENLDYRCTWRFNRLFVPNEIILVRWRPEDVFEVRANSASTSSSGAAHSDFIALGL